MGREVYRMKKQGSSTYSYVDGNTVRKAEPVIEIDREQLLREQQQQYALEIERKKRKRHMRMRREKMRGMDLFSVLFLSGAMILTAYSCVVYLEAQSQVTSMSKQLAQMEKNIINIKQENKVASEELYTEVDLDYVYKRATRKLGMVHPSEKQIITYEGTNSDTVKQYGEIPGETIRE